LRTLLADGVFDSIEQTARALITGLSDLAVSVGIPLQADYVGTIFGFYLLKTPQPAIVDYASAKQYADTERYALFFHAMLEQGVYFAPSQFEAGFMSSAHTSEDVQATLSVAMNIFSHFASN
jgi:glutamate-1-semialdehyde 2,1-aminomutase